MTRRLAWLFILAIVVFTAAIVQASIQLHHSVNRITYGTWELTYSGQEAGMTFIRDVSKEQRGGMWTISAPTIQTHAGKYLSGDPNGKQPVVVMTDKKSEFTVWGFEILGRHTPHGVDYKDGNTGYDFRITLANGPYKDWFVGMSELTEEQKKDQIKGAKKDFKASMKQILTPEQMEKLKEQKKPPL